MTEKRYGFEMDKNCYKCIVDTVDGKLYTDKKQVVDLLNELAEENKELQKENQMLKYTIGRNESYIARLTHKGEWKNTSKPLYRSINRGDLND